MRAVALAPDGLLGWPDYFLQHVSTFNAVAGNSCANGPAAVYLAGEKIRIVFNLIYYRCEFMNQDSNPIDTQQALECWFLTGATASGKTSTSIELAKLLDAEIISLDSMSIYRGMDIGTAKPSAEVRSLVPHHMIDILDPIQAFSVSQYREQAHKKIAEIRSRGKEVLFVGGTALYLKSLLRGLFGGPPADWEFRKQIEEELKDVDDELLYKRMADIDPVAASKIHPNDRRRIIRALEVYKTTGQPISHFQMEFADAKSADQCRVFTMRHERGILHQRIEQRVGEMFDEGLVDEVSKLVEKWNELGHTAGQAVGYREVIEHLQGQRELDETKEKVLVRTRRFARHQETWFRGLEECRMIDLDAEWNPQELAAQIHSLGMEVA